jgi:hypothetical protein
MRSNITQPTVALRVVAALTLVAYLVVLEKPPASAWRPTTPPVNATYYGGAGFDYAYSTAIDASGNHFVLGTFASTNLDFDPGVGTTSRATAGFDDIYISKFNSSGDFVWMKQIGGVDNDVANSLAIDALGNLYIGGRFQSTVDFDPGVGTSNLISSGSSDAFVLKLDSGGEFQWVRHIKGSTTSGYESLTSMTVDSSGVYAIGEFNETADFDPGVGTSNLVSNGQLDAFALKLDLDGAFQWVKNFGAGGNDSAKSLAVDSSGVYVTGGFSGTVNFNSSGSANLSTPDVNTVNGYLVKLDGNGAYQWAHKVGDLGSGVALDTSASYVHITGHFSGTNDFDPGAGTQNSTSIGVATDAYLLTLNTDGTFVRVARFGNSWTDQGRNITVDSSGNVLATGVFTTTSGGPVDFDPGPGTGNLTAQSTDVYVVKLTRSGSYVWARQFGGSNRETIFAITADSAGNAIVSGSWAGNMDLNTSDANMPTITSSTNPNDDAFVAKMRSTDGYTDTTAPTGSLRTITIRSSSRSTGHTISEQGFLYLVRDSITVTDLASITSAPDADWNQTGVAGAGSANLPVTSDGLRDGVYYAYGIDKSDNLSTRFTGSITIDSTTPVPSISITRSGSGTLTAGQTTTLTFTSSEELASIPTLSSSHVTKSVGTVGSLTRVSGTNSWTGLFTPPTNSSGTAEISVPASKVQDLDNNLNEASQILYIDYDTRTDTTPPTISISRSGSGSLGVGGTDLLTFTLSESSVNFINSDVTVSGGSLSGFSGSGTSYSATFTPTSNSSGTASISVGSGVFTDTAGNGNTASSTLSIAFDTVAPTTTTTVAPTTTTTVAPTTTTTVAPTTTTIAPKSVYSDWTVSVSPSSVTPGGTFTLETSVTCPNKLNNGMYYGSPTGTPLFKFEINNSAGVTIGGGEVWRAVQVLSNNNYTVTWTRSVIAPTTEGSYSVLVYSTGAAADYIYCKMQMNGRTNGPKTSLAVGSLSTTTTTNSVAPSAVLPVAGSRPTEVLTWTVSANGNNRMNPGEEVPVVVQLKCANTMNSDGAPWYPDMYLRLQRLTYDESWTMGSPQAGTDTFTVMTTGSASNVMLYSRTITAPSTPGVYTMTAYVRGDSRGVNTCSFRDGYQTNSFRVSLSVLAPTSPTSSTSTVPATTTTVPPSTSSTSTVPATTTTVPPSTSSTIPPLPESSSSLEREIPARPVGLVGGVVATPEVVQSPSSLTVTIGGVGISVGAVTNSNNKVALTTGGVVPVPSDGGLAIEVDGFVPASTVSVWLYLKSGGDPRYLRSFTASAVGATSVKIDVPGDLESGAGDIVISGSNELGERVSVGVPVQITTTTKSGGFTSSLLAGALFALGGFFIFMVLRRRDEVTVLNQSKR